MKHLFYSLIIPAAVMLLTLQAMAGAAEIRVVDNATLKAAYGAYTPSDMNILSKNLPMDKRKEAARISGSKFKVDSITELAYLDFISPGKIEAKDRSFIDTAFSKDRKGAINMCLLLYRGSIENSGSSQNYLEKIDSIITGYNLKMNRKEIRKLFVKNISGLIERLAEEKYKENNVDIPVSQRLSEIQPIIDYYKNPTAAKYKKLVEHTNKLLTKASRNSNYENNYLSFRGTLDSLSSDFADKVAADALKS